VNSSERAARLREILTQRFAPQQLIIEDQGHLHAGHAGAAGGLGHFRVHIVAAAFQGMPPVARHRQVYAAVAELMDREVHALTIEALPPSV
jgi:BolA protein